MAITLANRPFRLTTPLGPDKLLPVEFSGTEEVSKLFEFRLSMLAENATKIEFDKIIGQKIAVEIDMPGHKTRYFHGICNSFAEGRRDASFTRYKMEIVPQFWLLTRRTQCRIFQQINVPDILKQVLKGFDVKYELHGKYLERDYCVQYRESDFSFASRLMEEEGIYYYFQHDKNGHTQVIADTPQGHADVPDFPKAIFDEARGGNRDDMRVTDWEKVQELRSGKVTLWDNCFELPQQPLEAQKTIHEAVPVGKVTHKLKVADNDKLELYDYPGAYAQRFDGVDPGGGDRAGDLKKIFEDNTRVAKLRVEQEATESLEIRGTSNCRQFTAGQKFTLERHFNADGAYVLTGVTHTAKMGADYRTGEGDILSYENQFTCIPVALPFRPSLVMPKPTVAGTQTATVVGPAGEIITCDKYGRVKVQFHWDRHGKKDAKSSCWVRVSQNWGGANWGGMFIPHHGQEVIVDFEEGDPDRPLIIGRVYNAETMPPLELPANKSKSAIRDHGGNEIIMEGHGGVQQIKIHSPHKNTTLTMGAPRNPPEGFSFVTDGNGHFYVLENVKWDVDGNHSEDIAGNETITVHGHRVHKTYITSHELVGATKTLTVLGALNELVVVSRTEETGGFRAIVTGGYKKEHVAGWSSFSVGVNHSVSVGAMHSVKVGGKMTVNVGGDHGLDVVGDSIHEAGCALTLKGATVSVHGKNKVYIEDGAEITLKCGSSSIAMKPDSITLTATNITVKGTSDVNVGADAKLNLNGAAETNMAGGKVDIGSGGAIKVHGSRVDLN